MSDGGEPTTPTNVVWLEGDHYAYQHHVSLPGPGPSTPAHDRLASEGVRFDRAYCATPICVPSRATMMTGTYPHEHGFLDNGEHVDRDRLPQGSGRRYYADAFRESGRRAGYFGKWHVGYEDTAQDYGFEGWSLPGYGWPYSSERYADYLAARDLPEPVVDVEWCRDADPDSLTPHRPVEQGSYGSPYNACAGPMRTPAETHEAYFVASEANRWIEECVTAGDPFFARVVAWGPHQPYWPAGEFVDTVDPDGIPEYPNFDVDLSERPDHHRAFLERDDLDYSWADWQSILARCYEHVSTVDHALETVLDTLDRLGVADETLVIYTADHGDVVGAHGGGFDKGWLLVEETTRIPLVVRWPDGGVPAGETCDRLVCNTDYAPTMFAAAGEAPPAGTDGENLLPLARAPDRADWREDLLLEHHGHYGEWYVQRALHDGRYKYVAHLEDRDELYDLESDPYELENLIDDPALADVRTRLRRRLVAEMDALGDDAPDPRRLRERLVDQVASGE